MVVIHIHALLFQLQCTSGACQRQPSTELPQDEHLKTARFMMARGNARMGMARLKVSSTMVVRDLAAEGTASLASTMKRRKMYGAPQRISHLSSGFKCPKVQSRIAPMPNSGLSAREARRCGALHHESGQGTPSSETLWSTWRTTAQWRRSRRGWMLPISCA